MFALQQKLYQATEIPTKRIFFFFSILLSNFKGQYLPIAKYRGTKHVVARSSAEKLASNDIQTSKAGIAAGEACYEEVCVCVCVRVARREVETFCT